MALMHLNPTLDMIAEYLEAGGMSCVRSVPDPDQTYRAAIPFTGVHGMEKDLIYLVREEDIPRFPGEGYACISTRQVGGQGNRLCCPKGNREQLLSRVLELFCRLGTQEARLNDLVFSDGDLQSLCRLGEQITGNPVFIHDDWFILVASSDSMPPVMAPERVADSDRDYIPRRVVEEFQFDTDYEQTYSQRRCQLWNRTPGASQSLYVNLWQESRYTGRLLIMEVNRPFRAMDYLFAEALAQRAQMILRKQTPDARQYRNLDDVVTAMLENQSPDSGDLGFLLDTLRWKKSDQYLVIRIQNQQAGTPEVLSHMLHSELFRLFPSGYILYQAHQQSVILNLTREQLRASEVRYRLAPLCRDYCLYAGLSSPVSGISALSQAARQSDIALAQAFYTHGERWLVPFTDCALEYILNNLHTVLEPRYLAAPEWLMLLEHDEAKGTRYFETLRAYLLAERDIPKTAGNLIIHRTTLLYRLRRIFALTGLNPDDADQRLYLLLSLRILEHHRLIPGNNGTQTVQL